MDVIMPQLGETVAEGTVTKWYKKVGDTVKADDVLFDVETDKVSTEIPAQANGVIAEILVAEGATAKVGARLAVIRESGGERGAAQAKRRACRRIAAGRRRGSAAAAAPAGRERGRPAVAGGAQAARRARARSAPISAAPGATGASRARTCWLTSRSAAARAPWRTSRERAMRAMPLAGAGDGAAQQRAQAHRRAHGEVVDQRSRTCCRRSRRISRRWTQARRAAGAAWKSARRLFAHLPAVHRARGVARARASIRG